MLTCPNCQARNPDAARFCSNCGSPLDVARTVEGERKLVTVLFADVVGSTALAERLDPEDWAAIMNGAFGFMNAAVARYDGTVARLMGDAVLAFFGAPRTHEDDAERAVRAALAIRDAAVDYARTIGDEYDVEFRVRIGINTGRVVLGMLGDETRAEYTAMGDTTNVAARLQSAARPGTVLISGDTQRLVRHLFELESRGAAELKGRTEPIETYEVVAVRATPDTARGVEGLGSPVVGRDAEMTRLRALLADLEAGAGAMAAVLGEAGLGKSRLLAELRGAALASRWPPAWHECRGVSFGQSAAYHPWKQLGLAFIGADPTDNTDAVRASLHAFCRRTGVPADDVPLLETMLGVETASSRARLAQHGNDDRTKALADAVLRAIRASIHAGAEPLPHVLVFDDMHWADAASIELLARVANAVFDEPLLVLYALRPDRQAHGFRRLEQLSTILGERFLQLTLEPLDRTHARQLLANLLDVKDMPDHIRTLILEKSEGNPFFLEEVIRSFIDAGHLVHENGGWRATAEIANVAIPDTLAGVLAERIDRLPDPTKRVAQAAAVLGRAFYVRALSGLCQRTPEPDRVDNVEPHLGTLRYEELVRERAVIPEREYIFKHALTQETAYSLLLRRRRRELHRLAGAVLEDLFADRIDDVAPILAYHFERGGDAERTAMYAYRAGERASRLFAAAEAAEHYDDAYRAVRRLEQPPAELLLDTVLGWTVARYKLRNYDGVIDRLLEAETVARAASDRERLAHVLSWIALMYMLTGFPSRAEKYLIEGSDLARGLGNEKLMLLPFFFATDAMIDRDPRGAIEQMQDVVALARSNHMPEIEGHALASIAIAHARLGDFAGTDAYVAQALAAAPSGGHRVKEADVHLLVGVAYLESERPQPGLEHLRIGTELARAENALECVCAGSYGLGMGELERQQLDDALDHFNVALDVADRAGWSGWGGFVNRIRAGFAAAQLGLGEPRAVDDLETALANAQQDHDEYLAAHTAQQLAGIYLERDDRLDRAVSLIDDALSYYRRTGMVRYEARAQELRARLIERGGRIET